MWKSLSALFLIILLQQTSAQSVNISVYYESLCPDSKAFIDDQLFPTYKYIGNDLYVDLVPFGHAEVTNDSGTLEFTCQHGPKECYGNKIHSCAIALFSVEESTEFVYCSMKSDDPSADENLEMCANSTGISWDSLKICFSSGQADVLLERNGVKTSEVDPALSFVPTIIFNGVFNETLQNEAVVDLMTVVCEFLEYEPVPCKQHVHGNKVEVKLVF